MPACCRKSTSSGDTGFAMLVLLSRTTCEALGYGCRVSECQSRVILWVVGWSPSNTQSGYGGSRYALLVL